MGDPVRDVASDRKGKRANWLAGRSDRREYWVYVLVVMAIYAVLSWAGFDSGSGAGVGVMMLIQIRRFHDLGRTGWWAVALLAAQIAVTVPLLTLGDVGLGLATLMGLAATAVLGAIPGQPVENRFGPPRGQRPLTEIFR